MSVVPGNVGVASREVTANETMEMLASSPRLSHAECRRTKTPTKGLPLLPDARAPINTFVRTIIAIIMEI